MKRTFVGLVTFILVCVLICSSVMASDVFSLESSIGTEAVIYDTFINYGRNILENDKYVFMVTGASGPQFMARSSVHIYEKPTEENMGYKYLTTIKQHSVNASWDLPVRDIWVNGDILYINWNNAKTMKTNYAAALRAEDTTSSPIYRYDVSDVQEGDVLTGSFVCSGGVFAPAVNPYNRGGASFLDKENELYYCAVYSGTSLDNIAMKYSIYDVSASNPVLNKTLLGGSVDTNQFIVKDGFLFEVLQNNGGIGVTGRVSQPFNRVKIYNIAEAENNADISSLLVGDYVTEISGDWVINDIEVNDDAMYLATAEGLEVVDISAVKAATPGNPEELLLNERLHNGKKVFSLYIENDNLYVGLENSMRICDVSNSQITETVVHNATGGFQDFVVDSDKNILYSLSGDLKGKVSIINLDLLLNSLEVSNVEYECNGAAINTIANGELMFKMQVSNEKSKDIEFKSFYMLYEDNRLAKISTKDWIISSGESIEVSDSLTVESAENSYIRVMFSKTQDLSEILLMNSEDSFSFKQELGISEHPVFSTEESLEFEEIDGFGTIAAAGTVPQLKGKVMLVTVKNINADENDRLDKIRYIDVMTVDENGKYTFGFNPSDSGTYSVEISNIASFGEINKEIDIKAPVVEVCDSEEIPGVESQLYVNLSDGQNISKINLEIDFDSSTLEFGDEIVVSDEFALNNVNVENGKLFISLTRQKNGTKNEKELCVIPLSVKNTAAFGEYNILANVSVFDKYDTALDVNITNGKIKIKESTQKYAALDAAISALKLLNKADDVTVDDYVEELQKVTEAKEKVDVAYSFSLRDTQIGKDLIENLLKVEAKLAEFAPYYVALDKVNNEAEESIEATIKENKEYFSITEEAIEIYSDLTQKSVMNKTLADANFVKPSDVNRIFYEALVINAFEETRWQNVETLLCFAEKSSNLNLEKYNKLSDEEKANVNKSIALTRYDDISKLQNALDSAVKKLNNSTGAGGGGGGGGSSSSGKKPVSDSSSMPITAGLGPSNSSALQQGEKSEVFSDLSDYAWAKSAIEYLNEKGVVNGVGEGFFAPQDNVTREAFAKMIAVAFEVPVGDEEVNFTDVKDNAWYSKYIYALSNAKVINGRDDGSFGVGNYITREEIAVILDRVLEFKGIEVAALKNVEIPDAGDISEYAVSSIKKMCNAGIINGFEDSTVRPKENASRAQAAQLIYSVLITK